MEESEGPPHGQDKAQEPGAETEAQSSIGAAAPYSADFYIYSFKVVPCTATYAHNWSLCPFVHQNEKARRRDPRVYVYEPLPCPFDKKGANCPHSDACSFTHNVYEYWLHPKRFRTQMCQQGAACKRPLCFFAHNLQELRYVPADAAAATAGLLPGLARTSQQQQTEQQAATALIPGGPFVQTVLPYTMVPGRTVSAHHTGARLTSPGAAQLQALHAQSLQQQQQQHHQQQQQAPWMPSYVPQDYVIMGNAAGGSMVPTNTVVPAGDMEALTAQQQQQQYYLPSVGRYWLPQAASGVPSNYGAAAAGRTAADVSAAAGLGRVHLAPVDPSTLMGTQFPVVPDDQVLLSQTTVAGGADSSSGYGLPQQQQQYAQDASAAVISGSSYSLGMNPVASTASASVSMSVYSLPTAGLNSSASVPGSSNSSLSHIKHGQARIVTPVDVLQNNMQLMTIRDCQIHDL